MNPSPLVFVLVLLGTAVSVLLAFVLGALTGGWLTYAGMKGKSPLPTANPLTRLFGKTRADGEAQPERKGPTYPLLKA